MSSIEDPEELCMSRNCFADRQADRQTGRQADRPNRVNTEARPGQKVAGTVVAESYYVPTC